MYRSRLVNKNNVKGSLSLMMMVVLFVLLPIEVKAEWRGIFSFDRVHLSEIEDEHDVGVEGEVELEEELHVSDEDEVELEDEPDVGDENVDESEEPNVNGEEVEREFEEQMEWVALDGLDNGQWMKWVMFNPWAIFNVGNHQGLDVMVQNVNTIRQVVEEYWLIVEEVGRIQAEELMEEGENNPEDVAPYGETERMLIALTFDDGPTGSTEVILDTLERYGVRATFFVLGSMIESNEGIIRRAHENGNEVFGHSWSHSRLTGLSYDQVSSDITRTHEAITNIIGEAPRFFRPPYGVSNETVRQASRNLGFTMINWDVDPSDWATTDPDVIYDSIMEVVSPGTVMVLHDSRPSTAAAMERVIPSLIERGYKLVTLSELFYHLGVVPEPGTVYGAFW